MDTKPTLTRRELQRFVAIAFGLAIVTQLLAIRSGVHGAGHGLLGLTMWAPAIAALTASRSSRQMALAALRRRAWRSFGYALLIGWSMVGLQMLILALTHQGHWNRESFPLAADGSGIERVNGLAMALGFWKQSYPYFAINLVLSVTLGSVVTAVKGGVGEELGWRVVLQPELERRYGTLRGTLATGALWAYWHVPANLAGYNDSVHPLLNTFVLFPLVVIAMAFGFAWLTKRSGSVWPAALAHGANNTLTAGPLVIANSWAAEQAAGLAAAVIVVAFTSWRLLRTRAPVRAAWEPELRASAEVHCRRCRIARC